MFGTDSSRSSTGDVLAVPNLPQYRNTSHSNTRGVLRSRQAQSRGFGSPTRGEDDGFSVNSFESIDSLSNISKSLSVFPSNVSSFNDISGRYSLKSQQADRAQSRHALPYTNAQYIPPFITADTTLGPVCRFYAYFFEASPENDKKPLQTRKVTILYYISDDTIEINEPKVSNSGILQGIFLKRHKVQKNCKNTTQHLPKLPPRTASTNYGSPVKTPNSSNSPTRSFSPSKPIHSVDYVTLADFYAGGEVSIYQRKYFLYDCDEYTRMYFQHQLQRDFGSAVPVSELPIFDYDTCYANPSPSIVESQLQQLPPDGNDNFSVGGRSSSSMMQSRKLHTRSSTTNSHNRQTAVTRASARLYYEYDKKVLRYYGVWDNRHHLYGDMTRVMIHYYLAEGKFEIIPIHERNSGRDDQSILLKKSKLYKIGGIGQTSPDIHPKNGTANGSFDDMSISSHGSANQDPASHWSPVRGGGPDRDNGGGYTPTRPGTNSNRRGGASVNNSPAPPQRIQIHAGSSDEEDNNSLGDSLMDMNDDRSLIASTMTPSIIFHDVNDSQYAVDKSLNGADGTQVGDLACYSWEDIYIGFHLVISSMNILITDADRFTRDFYDGHHKPLNDAIDISVTPLDIKTNKLDCGIVKDPYKIPDKATMISESPYKDGGKLKEFQGIVLIYQARLLHNDKTIDQSRHFIISYHVEDDTVEVKEKIMRNSGFLGGTFLARGKVINPSAKPSRYYHPKDFSLHVTITIAGYTFHVIEITESTLDYMEKNALTIPWPHCNMELIMKQIMLKKEVICKVILLIKGLSSCVMDYDGIKKNIFDKIDEFHCWSQEVLTLCRYLDPTRTKQIKVTKLFKFINDYQGQQ